MVREKQKLEANDDKQDADKSEAISDLFETEEATEEFLSVRSICF